MKRRLQRIEIPGEHDARERTWATVQAAFAERERVTWPRRHARSLVLAAAAVAVVAAAVSPPGQSVVNTLRDAVGREKVVGVRPAHRGLVRLPTADRPGLLLNSRRGPWIVRANGTRRLVAPGYRMASWSPRGLFVAAVRGGELAAFEPHGRARWLKFRKQRLAYPRWSYEGYRIAYLSEDSLRVITGDGEQDWALGSADRRVPPAWRPATHDVAYVGLDGTVRLADADAKRVLWRARPWPDTVVRALTWSDDGRLLLVSGMSSLRIYAPDGRQLQSATTKGRPLSAEFKPGSHTIALVLNQMVLLVDGDGLRFPNRPLFSGKVRLSELTWSPDGRWLLVAWPQADQFVFVRVTDAKLDAVSNIARQFDPGVKVPRFPNVAGWCCS